MWTRDGRIMYSTDPAIRGGRFDIDQALVRAFAGTAASEFGTQEGSEAGGDTLPARFLEINVPIRGQSDGNPIGVFEVYMDAAPIETAVEKAKTTDVSKVTDAMIGIGKFVLHPDDAEVLAVPIWWVYAASLLLITAAVLALRYPLNHEKHRLIVKELVAKKKQEEERE